MLDGVRGRPGAPAPQSPPGYDVSSWRWVNWMLKVGAPLMVIAALALLPVLAWASYDVTGSSPPSPFRTGVRVPAECAGMTFDNVITGTAGPDTIGGGNGADLIFGLGGNDKIDGGNGPDCIVGGEGDDELKGGNGDDVILGGDGNDKLQASDGNDRLFGGAGDDEIKGGDGDDIIDGGPGVDECEGGDGANIITNCEEASSSSRLDQAAASVGPAETVQAFYSLLNERRFAVAYGMLSPDLRNSADFAPFDRWEQGYRHTVSISPIGVTVREQDEGQTVVEVQVESVDQRPSGGAIWQKFAGTWRLRDINGQWLLNQPHIALVEVAPLN